MNPPLPAPESETPICCVTEAAPRQRPQRMPPFIAFLKYVLSPLCFLKYGIANGSNTNAPISILTLLNVKVPTLSEETDWATNANPQIRDVRRSKSSALLSFMRVIIAPMAKVFICSSFCTFFFL